MITLYTGRPGCGKSLIMADTMEKILERNKRFYRNTKQVRPIYSNMSLARKYERHYKGYLRYWTEPDELTKLTDCDVFWDEIATHLDAQRYKETPLALKRWLQQHRKLGVEIYGTTQDFAMIDISMRRMTHRVLYLNKLIGNRDPSPTAPPIKYIWGIIIVKYIDPVDYREENKAMTAHGFTPFLITRKRVEMFDTRQEIKVGKYPPLTHIDRHCDTCGLVRPLHY